MGHYKSNLRDIEFNLFEVLGRDKLYGTGPFEGVRVVYHTADNIPHGPSQGQAGGREINEGWLAPAD